MSLALLFPPYARFMLLAHQRTLGTQPGVGCLNFSFSSSYGIFSYAIQSLEKHQDSRAIANLIIIFQIHIFFLKNLSALTFVYR